MSQIVGVDVAKRSFDVAMPLLAGKYRTKAKLDNEAAGFKAFGAWLERHAGPGSWVVMEATGVYHEALAEYVHARGYRVCVLNPAQVSLYARSQLQRVKTDRVDAKLIAGYAQRHEDLLRPWQPDPPGVRRLRARVRRLQDLQEIEQMEANRLEVAEAGVRDSVEQLLGHVREQIAQTLKDIREHIDEDPDLRGRRDLLQSIPGVGEKTAALLMAECGDLRRFRNGKALTAFAGLNPRLQESGQYAGQVRISRTGAAQLRAGLYMPALAAMTHNPAVRALKQRLKARGKAGKQVVCAAMRKLLHIAYGVIKSGRPFDPKRAVAG
jgi:transposase